jgi:hypothetical protein
MGIIPRCEGNHTDPIFSEQMDQSLRHLSDWRKINVYFIVGFADTSELLIMQYRSDFE